MVANDLFKLLPKLSEKELKVLLIIIRQTVGWRDASGKRKTRDWISTRYFAINTGLCAKSVSSAISLLIAKGLVRAETSAGKILKSPSVRKASQRTYYRCLLFHGKTKVKSSPAHGKILPTTKLTPTKLSQVPGQKEKATGRLTDLERYLQITGKKLG